MLSTIHSHLNSATPAQRVIVSIYLNLPLLLAVFTGLAAGLLIEDWRRLLNPFYMQLGFGVISVCALIQLAVLAYLWPRRKALGEAPLSTALLVVSVATYLAWVAILGGNLTYPTNLVIITVVPIGLLLLGTKVVLQGLAVAGIYLLINDYLLYRDLIPYAPAYSPAAFANNQYQLIAEIIRSGILYTSILGYALIIAVLAHHADQQRDELLLLVRSDSLTGISNRRHFISRLDQECSRQLRTQQGLCLAMIDADHFKQINDRYGHAMGDEVLIVIARLLGSHMRVPEDLPARLGGEEFAILFIDTDLEGAKTVCQRIQETLGQTPFVYQGQSFFVTLSIGLVEGHHLQADQLLLHADANLYKAKASGRDALVSSRVYGEDSEAELPPTA